jgi:hypothetical protein
MRVLVTQSVVSRGLRIAAVMLVGVLGVVALGFLPAGPIWVLLRLVVLLSVLAWVFARLKSAALSFFLGALLGLLLFQQPLDAYVQQLFKQAQSSTVFLIVLFGAALAVVSRQDLLEAVLRLRGIAHLNPEQTRLHNEAAVFCLLRRFDAWTQRTVASPLGRGVLVFCLALANFASSAPAVLFFKSLWAPGQEDFLTREEDRALAAGILCLCMMRSALSLYGGWATDVSLVALLH